MNFSQTKMLLPLLFFLVIGNSLFAQCEPNPCPPVPTGGTGSQEVILDGIMKVLWENEEVEQDVLTDCLSDRGGYVLLNMNLSMAVNSNIVSALRFTVTVADGNGNQRLVHAAANNTGTSLTYTADFTNLTEPFHLSGFGYDETLSFSLIFFAKNPVSYPIDTDLITSINVVADYDGFGIFEPFPYSYRIHSKVCYFGPPPPGTVRLPSYGSRFAQTDELNTLKVGPNPFSQQLQLTQVLNVEEQRKVSLWDLQGNQLKQGEITSSQQKLTWSTEKLAAGIYFLFSEDSQGNRWKKKVVKID